MPVSDMEIHDHISTFFENNIDGWQNLQTLYSSTKVQEKKNARRPCPF